jgi:type I restriction enzyme S subunit
MSEASGYPLVQLHQVTSRITDGSHFSPTPREYGHLIANVKDMKSGGIDFGTCTRISTAAYRELKATGCTIKNGNVLLSKDGTVGRVVVYRQDDEIGALSSICIIETAGQLDPAFLGHALQSEGCIRQYDNFMSGSALRRLVLRDIRSIKVPLPKSEHQRSIAQVLDTLDTTIHETEAIIAKLNAVKQGLLHDLLTRGIDANGKLRPPQTEAPHLYKDSPLGWIPKEWGCVQLAEKLAVRGGKRLPAGHDYASHPTAYKYLRVTDFIECEYSLSELESLHERTFMILERYEIQPGQLFISIAGTIGYIGVHRQDTADDVRTILTENAARLIPLCDQFPEFVAAYMNSAMVQRQVAVERGTGGGVPKLALFRIEKFCLAWPDLDEQEAIVLRLNAIDLRIRNEEQLLRKCELEKLGLMDDLLTGRTRVTPLLTESQNHLGGA